MGWIETGPGMVIGGLVLWLLLSIAFCFVLGQIAQRLKGPERAVERASAAGRKGHHIGISGRVGLPVRGLPEA